MKSRASFIVTALFVLAVVSAELRGEDWTSPDGMISVSIPDPEKFQPVPSPPPTFLVLWISSDETQRLGVVQTPFPVGMRIIKSSVEEGLAKALGGPVTESFATNVNGHEVLTMSARGNDSLLTQSAFAYGGSLYKLMAVTISAEPDTEAIKGFLGSLTISKPKGNEIAPSVMIQPTPSVSPSFAADATSGPGSEFTFDSHELSKTIGGGGMVLLTVALIWAASRRKKTQK